MSNPDAPISGPLADDVEHALRMRIARLEDALRSRDELLSITAHELRNPMHAVLLQISSASAAARRTGDAELIQRLDRTRSLVDRFVKRASLLLEVSRMRAGHATLSPEPVDLEELARDIADSYLPEAVFHGTPVIDVTVHGDCVGTWDRMALEQVLSNLVSNAIKYGAASPVGVVVRRSDAPAGVWVQVSDRGIGIATDDQQRIFERFEQVLAGERRRDGFGIGLWLVRRLVEAHGGTVSVASRVGEGTTFSVWLPIAAAAEGDF